VDEPKLTRAELLGAFRALNDELRRDHQHADLFIFGGAVMVLADAREWTHDVDGVWSAHGAVQRASLRVARDRGLPGSWLNEQGAMYLPRGYKPEGSVAFESGALRVIQAGPELMLALKVSAFRRGDIADIKWLADHLDLTDPLEIIELTERIMKEPLAEARCDDVHELFKPDPPQLDVGRTPPDAGLGR
jgi:hypothetical protein